jgi:hypothetical protein
MICDPVFADESEVGESSKRKGKSDTKRGKFVGAHLNLDVEADLRSKYCAIRYAVSPN